MSEKYGRSLREVVSRRHAPVCALKTSVHSRSRKATCWQNCSEIRRRRKKGGGERGRVTTCDTPPLSFLSLYEPNLLFAPGCYENRDKPKAFGRAYVDDVARRGGTHHRCGDVVDLRHKLGVAKHLLGGVGRNLVSAF